MKHSQPLMQPTNQTNRGPIFRNNDDELIVDYDSEGTDGTVTWSRLLFRNVVAFEYRQAACCRAEDIVDANEVRQVDESTWLSSVLKNWQESVGWQDWQRELGGAQRFKHFTVFFDDAGCINVVAAECRTASNVEISDCLKSQG